MRRVFPAALLAVLMLAVPTIARAQAKEGDKEIGIGGNLFTTFSSGANSSFGQFNFDVGYFVSDRFEVGVSPTIRITATGFPGQPAQPAVRVGNIVVIPATPAIPASTNWDANGGLALKGQYFFGEQSAKVKPYFGGTFIIQSFKTNGASFGDNTYLGVLGGVKSYFTPRTAFDFNGQYGFRTTSPSDFQLIQFSVGLTYLF